MKSCRCWPRGSGSRTYASKVKEADRGKYLSGSAAHHSAQHQRNSDTKAPEDPMTVEGESENVLKTPTNERVNL
jgi:hypothetical protein